MSSRIVQIRFPVWRELKQFQGFSLLFFLTFRYAFPFEGNWNLQASFRTAQSLSLVFRYAFPFEGNWNRKRPGSTISLIITFRYAFPFEGNWNNYHSIPISCPSPHPNKVQIRFPVWRELKQLPHPLSPDRWVQIRFPVWRELKRESSIPKSIVLRVQIRFPVWRELKHYGGAGSYFGT